ncbi:hypothetical protein HPP92_003462 [Vanilla planifolia]|uniref:WRKY domain-containing protein n=1 Tax=Vanilla planifolia TaxID=51239 RepID=A0A835S318_VANPL|nr:hypothetical protein HPP92_003462 [Vanilla planifolia]
MFIPFTYNPSGLSPAILLDSPMFLSNPLVEQLPTTVNAPSFEFSNVADTVVSNKTKDSPLEDIDLPSFAFKLPFPLFPNAEKKAALGSNHPQSLSTQGTCFHYPHQLNCQEEFPKPSAKKVDSGDALQEKGMSNAHVGMVCSPPMDDLQEGEAADLKDEPSSASLGAPSEDGYNWRKYGQKQVKGSEYPRSYYKCTQPNCQVKKKVERSHEGHITEIIYKGVHNHLKPPSNRRSAFPSSHLANEMQIDDLEHNGAGYDWKNDGLEANQSSSTVIEQCDQFSPLQAQGGVDGSSTLSNEEVEEDEQATHGSVSLGVDGDGDETESKRRKLDACALEMSAASRAVREPRVVVQTTSEIDILDDGYRWRKYGQKVVKGNPNPRSYYKCTNPGCTVRKHVERASHDLKSVITTYEGKHNHEVPAARTGGGQTTSSSATSCVIGAATPPSCLLPRRVEPPRIPDSFTRFDVHAPLGCFGYHAGHQQMGVGGHNFSFAMAQQGLSQHIAMAGWFRSHDLLESAGSAPSSCLCADASTGQYCRLGGAEGCAEGGRRS